MIMEKTTHGAAEFDHEASSLRPDLRALAMRIKRSVRHETNGGVQKLDVRIDSGGVFLSGHCSSFYCKQLAQTAAMRLSGGASVFNQIEVAQTDPIGPDHDPYLP
jgi:osmotically-inducible protein OsmY